MVEIVYFPVYFYFMLFAIHNGTGIWGYPYTIKKVTWDIDELIDFVIVDGFCECLVSASIPALTRRSTFVGP